MHRLVLFAFVTFLVAPVVAPALAAEPPVPLVAHRATYDLTPAQIRGAGISGVTGTMTYEVIDACDGWASRQRLQMTVTNRDGQDIQMVSDYTTWEAKNGLSMRFRMRQTTEGAVTSEVAGSASLEKTGGPGEVHYTLPERAVRPLPAGTLFPMKHTAAILQAAKAGKKFLGVPLFDGTGDKGGQDTSVVVLSWGKSPAGKWPALAALPSGRVHVAFFDRDAASLQPDYEVSMRYWENGVADDLGMDFGDFLLKGSLSQLAFLPSRC